MGGSIGIAFEVCCGLVTTWTFAGTAMGIAQIGLLFGIGVWEQALDLDNKTASSQSVDIGNYCPHSCKQATTNIQSEWLAFANNVSSASTLAFVAASVSILALICTCVGFCIQKQQAKRDGGTYAPNQNTTTVITTTTAPVAATSKQPLGATPAVAYAVEPPVPMATAVATTATASY